MTCGRFQLTAKPLLLLLSLTAAATVDCTTKEPTANYQIAASAAQAPARAPISSATATASSRPLAPVEFVEALRLGQWELANERLALLDANQTTEPAIRYVRARVALEVGDYPRAAHLLADLEQALPLLAPDISYYRAEAQLHAGPQEQAARYFASQASVRGLTKAAIAWHKADRFKEARAAIDRAIVQAKRRGGDDLIEAYRVRARIAEAMGDRAQAIADLRMVARAGSPDDDESEMLDRLGAKNGLTASDRLQRARALARRGRVDEALHELDRLAATNTPKAQLRYERAMAMYQGRSDYALAAKLFEEAARLGGPLAAESLYYAAKSFSRADQNSRGLELYRQVMRRFGRSIWAERALYQAARLQRLEARWLDAAGDYSQYIRRYPRGSLVQEARYELALCLLLGGKAKQALPVLEQLARAQNSPADKAALRQLVAVARFEAGDRAEAMRVWRDIIAQEPLTWAASASAARLALAGEPVSSMLAPALPLQGKTELKFRLPPDVRLLHELGLDADAEEHLMDQERALSKQYGDRSAEALCNLYGQLGRARRLHRVGQLHAPASLLKTEPSSETLWAWHCLFPRPYEPMVRELEQREQLPVGLMYAVMRQESAFNPEARSPVGARGLMQLMPATARKLVERSPTKLDLNRLEAPAVNMQLGAAYLRMLLTIFEGHEVLAAAAYNAGPRAVARWLGRTGQVPLDVWVGQIPYAETRRYVWRVMGNLNRYRYLLQGPEAIGTVALTLPERIDLPHDAF